MSTRNAKSMLAQMKLTDKSVGIIISNDGQGLITIDDLSQLNEKSVEGLFRVLQKPVGTTGGCPIPGMQCQRWLKRNYKEWFTTLSIARGLGAHACMPMLG